VQGYFDDIVYAILSYIVILELIKMLGQYIFDRRFNMVLVLDTFFIFTLRETILMYSSKHHNASITIMEFNQNIIAINEKIFYIFIGISIMVTLIYFRNHNKFGKRRKKHRNVNKGNFFKHNLSV